MTVRHAALLLVLGAVACSTPDDGPRSMRLPPVEALDGETDAQADLADAQLAAATLAPFPYTPEQIRDAMPIGFTMRNRVEQSGRPAMVQVTRVTARDDSEVTLASHSEGPDGVALAEPVSTQETWAGLRDHATFPLVDTDRRRLDVEVPAGTFDCWRYEVTTTAGDVSLVSVFDFALVKPGSPVRFERVENGRRTFLMELLSYGVEGQPSRVAPRDARELVEGLQATEDFPTTIHFVQDVVGHRPDGSTTNGSMEEWAQVPGQLRIDRLGEPAGTTLYDGDRTWVLDAERRDSRPGPSVPMLLMIDVLAEEPDAWLERARGHGLDVSVLSHQPFDGRDHWVLGAEAGDLTSLQVWFDAATWLPSRYLETQATPDGTRTTEGRAFDYRRFDGKTFHTRFEFLVEGVLVLEEVYRDVELDAPLPAGVFDPEVIAAGLEG